MRLILKLIERDGFDCPLCDITLNHGPINIDHRIPQAHGGTDGADYGNLQVTHVKCNFERGHRSCPECEKENKELCQGRQKRLQKIEAKKELNKKIKAAKTDSFIPIFGGNNNSPTIAETWGYKKKGSSG